TVSAPARPVPAGANTAVFNLWHVAWVAWLIGVSLALLPTAGGMFSLWRLERRSRHETSFTWLDLLRQLLAGLGLNRPVRLLKSARRRMPMTWGVWRPRVLLPEESESWPAERRRVVLLHELAHAKRWDYATQLAAQLACALHWFNPLVWLAARPMVTERERACDDIVLSHGAKPADYAEQVLEIAVGVPLGRLAAFGGIAMARPSKLESRLRAILEGRRNRAALTRMAVLSALALAAVVVVPVAMVRAAPGQAATPAAQGAAGPATSFSSNGVVALHPATLVGRWYDGREGASTMLELNADGGGRIVSKRADYIRWQYNKDTGLVSLSYLAQYDPTKVTRTLRFSPNADALVGEFYGPDDKEHTFRRPSRSANSSRGLGESIGGNWGEPVEGFRVRLHAPTPTERDCTTNYHLWQLEVDGSWYVPATSMKSDPLIDGTSGSGSVGALLEVFPGYPWTNLPLVLNAVWRTAHSNEVGTAQLGGGGIWYSAGFKPERLKLAPGKHTVVLAVLGAPKFAGPVPVRALSEPVDIEVQTNVPERLGLNATPPGGNSAQSQPTGDIPGRLVDDETGEAITNVSKF
ncbi:MAG: M56 family metallopeptidase, partial [Verrucomicrobia bacterium]|nr:M56 family metallopeptidase [Verrucomicrobiota bacterium]